ncbi:MAG: replication protein [Clostridiales bacterium]|nr:replication protein [Clostridiales bacterium]
MRQNNNGGYMQTTRRLRDEETGEVVEAVQIIKQVHDQRQFWKLYLKDFLSALGSCENKQLKVLIYILKNTHPSNNMFIGTFAKISKECEVSMDTVQRAVKKFKAVGLLAKMQNGVYFVNPDIMMKGSDGKKHLLVQYYDEALYKMGSAHNDAAVQANRHGDDD